MPVLVRVQADDVYIVADDATTNYEGQTRLFVGATSGGSQRRTLLKFDISALPGGATIERAWLQLTLEQQPDTIARVIGAHRCLVDWNKTQATWNQRVTGTNWGAAGGLAGTDYTATATSKQIIGRLATYSFNVTADVDAWYQGTATNYGWFLINESQATSSSAKNFCSVENTITGIDGRPRLVVVYDDGSTFSDPTDYSACELWLDATTGVYSDAGVTPAGDTDAVQEWHDQSGNAVNATQTTGGDQPTYHTSIQNGLPGILFDGTDDNLEVDGLATSLSGTNQHMTCFLVVTPDNSAAQICPISVSKASTTNPDWRIQIETAGGSYKARAVREDDSANSFETESIIPITADSPYIISSIFVGDREAIGINLTTPDVVSASIGQAATSTLDQARIGIRLIGAVEAVPFDGYIHEIIVYSRALSLREIQEVERYLTDKWNIVKASQFRADYMAEVCVTPTYESGTSGQTIHPSVIDTGTAGWNGYRYWMGNTPLPDSADQYENPSIYVSEDKLIWSVPAGGSNPIDAFPGAGIYNSDAELLLSANTLYCYYREVDGSDRRILVRKSTDGVSWGSETELITSSTDTVLSPSVIHDDRLGKYVMYTIDSTGASSMNRRIASVPDGSWSAAENCTIYGMPDGRELWHLDVIKHRGMYLAAIACSKASTTGLSLCVYMATSENGSAWTIDDHAVFGPRIWGGFYDVGPYRPTFVVTDSGIDMWFGGRYTSTTLCATGYLALSGSISAAPRAKFPFHHRLR